MPFQSSGGSIHFVQEVFAMEQAKKNQLGGSLILLLTAFIWGSSFVAQSVGMEKIDSFTFNGIRTLMGAAALIPLLIVLTLKKRKTDERTAEEKKRQRLHQLKCGVICGLILFTAGNLQQAAFHYSTPGKIGFLTAIYMLLVPIFGLAIKQKPRARVWVTVVMGCFGAYLLCVSEKMSFGKGEVLAVSCAVFFAIHILYIDHVVASVDSIWLSFTQFVVAGTLGVICMALFETPVRADINAAIWPLLYSGVLSCGAAFTLQIVGQRHTEPAVASILMCLESVFAVLTDWIILHNRLSLRQILGCSIMFLAIIINNLPDKRKK